MTLFRSLMRTTLTSACFREVLVSFLPPAEGLRQAIAVTNRYVLETHGEEGIFCVLFAGVLDTTTGELAYANCGSAPPFVVGSGALRQELWPTGLVVGILEEATFDVREIDLSPGQTVVAYTDGVTDALDVAGREFG